MYYQPFYAYIPIFTPDVRWPDVLALDMLIVYLKVYNINQNILNIVTLCTGELETLNTNNMDAVVTFSLMTTNHGNICFYFDIGNPIFFILELNRKFPLAYPLI